MNTAVVDLFLRYADNPGPPYKVTGVRVMNRSVDPVTWVATRTVNGVPVVPEERFTFTFPGGTLNADGTVTERETTLNIPPGRNIEMDANLVLQNWQINFMGPTRTPGPVRKR
jgi:hypothetical protein